MIVVDSSAWVEFLRRSGSAVNERLRSALRASEDLAVTEVVGCASETRDVRVAKSHLARNDLAGLERE